MGPTDSFCTNTDNAPYLWNSVNQAISSCWIRNELVISPVPPFLSNNMQLLRLCIILQNELWSQTPLSTLNVINLMIVAAMQHYFLLLVLSLTLLPVSVKTWQSKTAWLIHFWWENNYLKNKPQYGVYTSTHRQSSVAPGIGLMDVLPAVKLRWLYRFGSRLGLWRHVTACREIHLTWDCMHQVVIVVKTDHWNLSNNV